MNKLKLNIMEAEKIKERPKAQVIGQDGNVYNRLAICARALRQAGFDYEMEREIKKRVEESESYDAAQLIMQEYCEFV